MIEIVEQAPYKVQTEVKNPVCPHCNQEIRTIYMQKISAFLGRRFLYYCAHCLKVLGISHRKGFWMG